MQRKSDRFIVTSTFLFIHSLAKQITVIVNEMSVFKNMLNIMICKFLVLKLIYHPLYGMNNYVLIWGDWLSCDPLRGSPDS